MPAKGYTTISIPTDMHKRMKELVKENRHLYSSLSELVKDALRDLIIRLETKG